jgi:hypothetical protein
VDVGDKTIPNMSVETQRVEPAPSSVETVRLSSPAPAETQKIELPSTDTIKLPPAAPSSGDGTMKLS